MYSLCIGFGGGDAVRKNGENGIYSSQVDLNLTHFDPGSNHSL